MEPKIAIPLSIGIIAATFTAFAFARKKPYITTAIMGTIGAFSLVYSLAKKEEII